MMLVIRNRYLKFEVDHLRDKRRKSKNLIEKNLCPSGDISKKYCFLSYKP
jgi:hypothetical protein